MKKLALILPILLAFACSSQPSADSSDDLVNVTYGSIVRLDSFPSRLVSPRNIDIWLPIGYSKDKSYPVLYMHDGQMLFDSTKTWNKQEWGVDETLGRLIVEGKVQPVIVVGIWNGGEDRHADYFPQKPFEMLSEAAQDTLIQKASRPNGEKFFSKPVQSDAYLRFITQELKPYIDDNYPTLPEQENTFIAGSSMGGLISMYAFCEYPDVFGGAACLSTHWPGTLPEEGNPIPSLFFDYIGKNLPDPKGRKLYFDHGTETLDASYGVHQQKVDSIVRRKGYTTFSYKSEKYQGADHSENAWKERLSTPMEFLLSES